jgi:2-pyrone-4,6-dicarboxylate lactonase
MPDIKVVHDVIRRATPLGWHLVVHLDAVDIVELSSMLRSLPLPFVIDHIGRVKASAGVDQALFERCSTSFRWRTAG